MMNYLKSYKEKLIKTYRDLNNIDLNSIFEKLKNTNLSDIKNLNSKDIISYLKASNYLKPIVGFLIFSSFIYFLLIPNIKSFNSKYKLSRQYIKESQDLPNSNNDLINMKKKYKKINSSMVEIKSSIIEKDKLIYLTNLFDDLSKSTSVRIDFFSPTNKIQKESICKISEVNKLSKNLLTKKNSYKSNNKNINNAIYELKLYGNYLNIIFFLNSIQNYDLMIIPSCIQVIEENDDEFIKSGFVKANLVIELPIR